MQRILFQMNLRMAMSSFRREITVCCLAAILAVTLGLSLEVQPVSAAPVSAPTIRQDRRPDRERPVATQQGSSQTSASSGSTSHARPRLVRR
ncbi:MAG: hypothetical protein IT328_16155 [Caldilineaceae bacterium]|nr:hypothetical protein [Caldilineaceae bacterium]